VHLGHFWPAQLGLGCQPLSKTGVHPPWRGVAVSAKFPASRRRGQSGNGSRRRPTRGGARFRGWSKEKAHRPTLSMVVVTRRQAPTAVARTRGRGARRLGRGAAWRCLIAWGGTLGADNDWRRGSTVSCFLRRRRLLGCSGCCSPDALRTATVSGSRSRARVKSPGACSPQLLIDGCTALRGEQRGGRLHVVLSSEKRKAKRLWPQRQEDRGVVRRWAAHAAGGHQRRTVTIRGVTRACARATGAPG
jgi:hypothetical protein